MGFFLVSRGIVRVVTTDVFSMVLVRAVAGLSLGMLSARYVESLFYQVRAADLQMLALPSLLFLRRPCSRHCVQL